MEKAVCYVRVSTEEQARGGVSLDAQEERVKAYCKAQGFEVFKIIRDEGVSAGKPLSTRPGGQQLLEIIRKREARHIVAMKLDRLFRNTLDCLENVTRWDKLCVGLHLLDLAVNTSTAAGRAFLQIAAAFAEMERALIAERTATALNHKKSHLEVYSCIPFGFDRDGNKLVTNQEERGYVSKIKAWKQAGWSLRKIASELERLGVPTKKGGKWHASTVQCILENSIHEEAS